MDSFMNFVQTANLILFIVLCIFVIVCFMLLAQTNRKLTRLRRRYDILLRGRGELDLEGLIGEHSADIERNNQRMQEIEEKTDQRITQLIRDFQDVEGSISSSIQKVGYHRYNAFDYVTNEMSFSIALLDSRSNGIILTSIFGSDSSTTFAKEVRKGKSNQELSIEEEIALGRALQGD